MMTTPTPNITVPGYPTTDYRGFLFVVHENHGLMLLYCTRKKKKGAHWQLPGGHIDQEEFIEAGE
jgi:8-oxo-dGTP pyrophosphatase MutT (NUDIX family)